MINRKTFNTLLIVSAIASTLAALSGRSVAENLPDRIRIGDVGFGFGQPFGRGLIAIADAKGFLADEFKDTPVKLEFTYFVNTGPAINEAIAFGASLNSTIRSARFPPSTSFMLK